MIKETMPYQKQQLDDALGIQELYTPRNGEPEIDIVAVHGLNGHSRRTWTNKTTGVSWLNDPDYLPKFMPNARVVSWGYNASFSSMTGATPSGEMIHHHAQTLLANLSADRRFARTSSKPIIFLCHSLGGIIVKRALTIARTKTSTKSTQDAHLLACTTALLFFGTPHHGSSKATWLTYLKRLSPNPTYSSSNSAHLLTALERDSETLQNITLDFVPLMKRFRIFFFWEQERTKLAGGLLPTDYIVPSASAAPVHDETERCGIADTHSGMVKFASPSAQGFRTVVDGLVRFAEAAPMVVGANLAGEAELMARERRRAVVEMFGSGGRFGRSEDLKEWEEGMPAKAGILPFLSRENTLFLEGVVEHPRAGRVRA